MSHHVRLLTVHTTDMSRKLLPLKRMHCAIRDGATIAGATVTEENVDQLIADGIVNLENVDDILDPQLRLSQVRLQYGAPSIECEFDDLLSSPYIIGAAIDAEAAGCSAVVIDCVGDPALHAAREAVRIPVVGAGEAAFHMAATLCHRFSVVTITDRVRPIIESHLRMSGLAGRCGSVRSIEISGVHTEHDANAIYDLLARESLSAVSQDGAEAIVLGCTAFLGASRHVAAFLAQHGKAGVPVIDPLPAAIATAKSLVEVGLSHSFATYPPPPLKPRTGYELPNKYQDTVNGI